MICSVKIIQPNKNVKSLYNSEKKYYSLSKIYQKYQVLNLIIWSIFIYCICLYKNRTRVSSSPTHLTQEEMKFSNLGICFFFFLFDIAAVQKRFSENPTTQCSAIGKTLRVFDIRKFFCRWLKQQLPQWQHQNSKQLPSLWRILLPHPNWLFHCEGDFLGQILL